MNPQSETLVTPNPGGGAYTHSINYDGNARMTKTTDFKGTSHYYAYDALSRMTGHGATSSANDETYTWGCCSEMSAYSDGLGTASLSYDDLSRLTSQTDSNGNNVAYEYDALGRVTKLTPAQGTNYRTEYQYKKNGSLSKAKVYDAGSAADTDYTYDTTSGLLTQRNFPATIGSNIRTTYAYDSAGRLEYETQTREAAGTTNLYKTQYAYSYIAAGSGGGRQLVRTEQAYSGGAWVNDNKLTYQHDALGRQNYEERHDWAGGAWSNRYDTTQSYDKNGNRTGYDHNIAVGNASNYCRAANLSYTFNAVNQLTAISDADESQYGAALTCDANGNITQVVETYTTGAPPVINSTLTTDFTYDDLNRLTQHKTTRYVGGGTNKTQYTERNHYYDATGRLAKSDYTQYYAGDTPTVNALEHVYAGQRMVQNYDGTTYGDVWYWAGADNEHSAPLKSPNPDTASQKGYNIASAGGKGTPQRRTWQSPATEGNKREIFGQGRPMAKDSSGNGANWWQGTKSDPPISGTAVESRFFFEGTVSSTDMSRATDARELGRIGIFGTSNSYAGSYGRILNEALGRDLNPLGRGDGESYLAGSINQYDIAPRLPYSNAQRGMGNSVNNGQFTGITGPPAPPPVVNLAPIYPPYIDIACVHKWCEQYGHRSCCGFDRPYSENWKWLNYCGQCGTWGCSGVDHCLDPVGCAYKMCKFRAEHHGCGECRPWCWGDPCWPYGCINCGKWSRCPKVQSTIVFSARQVPAVSPNIDIFCNAKWKPYVTSALSSVLSAVNGGCVSNSCSSQNGSTNNLRDCVVDLLTQGGFFIRCRSLWGNHRFGHSSQKGMDIWPREITTACPGATADEFATVILHELIHICLLRNGPQSSCCNDQVLVSEQLPLLCQYNCFPKTCITKMHIAANPNIPNEPANCCGVCQ